MRDIRYVVFHTPGPNWKPGVPVFQQELPAIALVRVDHLDDGLDRQHRRQQGLGPADPAALAQVVERGGSAGRAVYGVEEGQAVTGRNRRQRLGEAGRQRFRGANAPRRWPKPKQ